MDVREDFLDGDPALVASKDQMRAEALDMLRDAHQFALIVMDTAGIAKGMGAVTDVDADRFPALMEKVMGESAGG